MSGKAHSQLLHTCVQKRQYDKKEKLTKRIATTIQTNQNCMLNSKVSCATSLLESEDID